jgi:hypothetical protein
MQQVKEIELEPGYYFSPGFYKSFWESRIEKKFPRNTINKNVKFKKYREVWLGAIIAAAQTKITGQKHFVGLPNSEPPDVLVVRFSPITTKKGSEGTNIDGMPIEITRCSLDDGEDLYKQIALKNKPAYTDTILAVYLYGGTMPFDMNEVGRKIMAEKKIYPSEILVIGNVERTSSIILPKGTFAQVKLYPEKGEDLINLNDSEAFFNYPGIMTTTKRGVSRKLEPLGKLRLMPPNIKQI